MFFRATACRTDMVMCGGGARQSLPAALVKHDSALGTRCRLRGLGARVIRIVHDFFDLTIKMMAAMGSGFLFIHGDSDFYRLLRIRLTAAAGPFLMVLYISAHPANAVFKLPAGRVKCVAQGDIDILVSIVIHHDNVARHVQGDPHVEAIALVFMFVRLLDGNMATHQMRMK